jgi:hypothetical protein
MMPLAKGGADHSAKARATPMPPLALSDAELDIVTNACAPCAPRIAAPFVALSIEHERERQLGPDSLVVLE